MCLICDRGREFIIKNKNNPKKDVIGTILIMVADSDKSPEHFKDLLDEVLGTQIEDRDKDMESKWEKEYRNGKG